MKNLMLVTGVLVLCLGLGCGSRGAGRGAVATLAAEEIPLIEQAEELGARIYVHDRLAAEATELLLSHGVNLAAADTRGWITEDRGEAFAVTFVTGDPDEWRSVSMVTFAEPEEPNIILVDRDLTATQSARFNARQRVLENIERACSDAYNTVVLPRADGEGWLAYALAATSDPNLILVGGHCRATVSADGLTVLEQRAFTKDCVVLKRPQNITPDVNVAAYTLAHVLDNRPTEIHVFLNLLYGKPLYVATADRRLWYIQDGKIELLKRL
jgi:hypothetical protein